ncbi:electron transfer flavoprotein subunit alpha/FixB family protein [Paraburkholderia aromaticivorans]|uniref:electron transfer flavoprotein subunit alpha/FixB family protein n=1 Tax=Paraburkholderia aromaticivorans TaxID=2026199 RepID=UPI0014561314|nr:FAD-binding protein [Paraburkholderia aromaticivorans]
MNILVIAEHDNQQLKPVTLNVVRAATECGTQVHVLVAGKNCSAVAEQVSKAVGVSRVLLADGDVLQDGLAETTAAQVVRIAANYTHVLAPATAFGKSVAPRIAALLDVAQISEITKVVSADTFERPIYAGSVIVTVRSSDAIKVLTVRATAFSADPADQASASIESIQVVDGFSRTRFVGRTTTKLDRPELGAAKIVVSGGRGLGSGENYTKVLEPLASKLGAALGASRAAVDAGYVPNDYQVGQTGKIVAPQLYVAVGISGAIQHLAGMKDSKVIVAINKDPEAPIFSIADYGLVADLFEAVPEMVEAL